MLLFERSNADHAFFDITTCFLYSQSYNGITDSLVSGVLSCFFFFEAEDGIRDDLVTGVQTCALPISGDPPAHPAYLRAGWARPYRSTLSRYAERRSARLPHAGPLRLARPAPPGTIERNTTKQDAMEEDDIVAGWSERIRLASAEGRALRIRGGGTKDWYGQALEGRILVTRA